MLLQRTGIAFAAPIPMVPNIATHHAAHNSAFAFIVLWN
ncbi:hypothetical protein BURPS668_A1986 [Burkholderia pseudomallei 668]|nr:hypothetical protein BURPS668_A1986 [Burkholderia pseudomallei 668]